ncbi:protoporphyrinogen oxidase [Haloechinothrix halophila]|uniref:protoporphyrinogen oxidase n=1 Tax=Haloechinothrix halophila TaxID=1069073 RepID=UPI0003F5E633|nr:protoporphyrinogen oxidase [Haloechinothrix halophila]
MKVAVVGAGISGLTAAYRLRQALGDDAELTVFDAADRPGGKLRTETLAGTDGAAVDVGAEAFLVRRPEAVALAEELGLGDRVVHPTSMRPRVRAGGRTAPLPTGTLMGIPASAAQVAGVLSEDGVAAVAAEPTLPPPTLPGHDVSLGALLRERFGNELVDRLVDPLLAGVYGGGADSLGLRAVLPALAERIDAGTASLTEAVAGLLPPASDSPVFGTLPGGLGVLVDALVDAARADVVTGAMVRELHRTETGWRLSVTTDAGTRSEDCDAVLLAVPAPAARKLLASAGDENAATDLADVELASMAVVALALPSGTALPEASGILIGAGETWDDGTPFTAKAFTLSSRKWAHLDSDHGGPVLLRGSVGRFGDPDALRPTDDELIRRVRADLAELTGITTEPVAATVRRWGGGLPQYGVGHPERVARIERHVAALGRIALAGATWHGVGIPACVATASAAAHELADQLLPASALVGD